MISSGSKSFASQVENVGVKNLLVQTQIMKRTAKDPTLEFGILLTYGSGSSIRRMGKIQGEGAVCLMNKPERFDLHCAKSRSARGANFNVAASATRWPPE